MNRSLLRLLDANCNRVREALRVIEDYARFMLDDAAICTAIKQIRHDFAEATRSIAEEAIVHRDTPGDVGTTIKTDAELGRDDVAHVVTAAGKRLGEALRAIEEFLKTEDPAPARMIESIRYRFYDVERRVALTLRSAGGLSRAQSRGVFANVRLYVLITESLCRRPWLQVADAAIAGGADCLQLREKDLESGEFLRRAIELVSLCKRHRVLSIVNDRPDIAILSGADGVHLGQSDLPAQDVRKLVGRRTFIGVSTHTVEQARQAILDGADYIGVGPVFKSATKPRDIHPGLPFAREITEKLGDRIPAVAIAGITESTVDEVLASGIRSVAVSSAIIGCDDVSGAAKRLKEKLTRVLETDVRNDLPNLSRGVQ